jgi:LysM repeat protein
MKQLKFSVILAVCILLLLPAAAVSAADYKVVPNDSLYKISQLFKTPIATIKQDNRLSSDAIRVGQVLDVPALSYTVKSGDSLYLIAARYGISLDALRKANAKWDNTIMPGQKLLIPGVKAESTKSESKKSESKSDTVIPYTKSEVDLLARLIEAEASGESYQAKVAVGGVVVNRVQSKEWASTITDVIYQVSGGYYQFTPVKNGMIKKPASSDSIKAAWAALYGSDPSKGASFYFDDSSTNTWLWSKTQTAYIGRLVFVK